MKTTTKSSVAARIRAKTVAAGAGSVFTPHDFLDLGGRAAVDQALSRLVKGGALRRLARGLYDYPKTHARLGVLSPDPDAVAQALARETGSRVQVGGAQAANVLGVSTQVSAKTSYLTDGPARRVVVGKRVIDLKHAGPKHLIAPGTSVGTVVQALRYLGPRYAPSAATAMGHRLSADDKKTLAANAVRAPGWMRPVLIALACPTSSTAHG